MKKKIYHYWDALKNHPELDGALVRWGIVLSLLIIVSMWVVDPYIDWRQQQHKIIASSQRQVLKLKALQASADKWQQALQNSKEQTNETPDVLIQAESYALAQQKINTLIKSQIEQHKLRLHTQNLLEEQHANIGSQIGLQFYLSGNMLNIISFIDAITHLPQILTIEQLMITQGRDNSVIDITLAAYQDNDQPK